jgi:Tfp pilus assembly protein PilF
MIYIIPLKILEEIQKESIKKSNYPIYSEKKLSEQIKKYYEEKLKEKDSDLYFNYNNKNEERRGFSPRAIQRAMKRDGKEHDGATEELCRLLCYFAFDKKFEDVLKDYKGYNLADLAEETICIRNVYEETHSNKRGELQTKTDENKEISESKSEKSEKEYEIKPFKKGKYNILILPFRNPDKNDEVTFLGRNLEKGLQEKNKYQNLGLEIKYLSSFTDDISYELAKIIGQKFKADIIIWGNDSKIESNPHHVIYFHYVNITDVFYYEQITKEGKTTRFETDRLIEITEGNLQLEIDNIILWFLGNKLYLKKEFDRSITIYKKIELGKNINEELFQAMANCYSHMKLFDKAMEYYEKALDINPNNAITNFNYALLFHNNFKNPQKAKVYYEKALKIVPNNLKVLNNYAILLMDKLSNPKKAKVYYEKALKIDPNNIKVLNNYSVLLYKYFDNKEQAMINFKKIIENDPNNIDVNLNYAILLETKFNDIKGAYYHYKKALKNNRENPIFHLKYAIFLIEKYCNFEEAKDQFEKVYEIEPDYLNTRFVYAVLLKKFNDNKNARKHYREAIRINPEIKTKENDKFFEI